MKIIRYAAIAFILFALALKIFQPELLSQEVDSKSSASSESKIPIGGEFVLTNQDGEKIASKNLNDKHKLIFFGFTNCPAICPTSMAVISAALDDVKNVNKIYPIFISVDPERDNPDQVKTFLENFHPNFIGLTGSVEEIEDVKTKFRIFAEKAEIELDGMYDMQHSSIIYLFDEDWNYVRHFNHKNNSEAIAKALREEL